MGWLLILILIQLAISGCSIPKYNHANYTPQLWNRDSYECERDARQSGYFGTGIVGAINMGAFSERCLFARGWWKEEDDRAQRVGAPSSADPLLDAKQSTGNAAAGPDAP